MLVEVLVHYQNLHKVSDHLRLLNSAIPLLLLGQSVKSVAHDSDQHVQKHNISEKGCQHEVDPLKGAVLTPLISEEIVVTHPEQVLVYPRVEDRAWGLRSKQVLVFVFGLTQGVSIISVNDLLGKRESRNDHEEEYHKVSQVINCLSEHFDVEGQFWE